MDIIDEICHQPAVGSVPHWKTVSKKSGPTVLTPSHFPVFCKDTKEVCNNYDSYLKSKHWQLLKKRFYASALFHSSTHYGGINGMCLCCQTPGKPLQLHHITYRRLGQEKLWDLIPTCDDCHGKIHNFLKKKKYQNANLSKKARLMKKTSWKKVRKGNGLYQK